MSNNRQKPSNKHPPVVVDLEFDQWGEDAAANQLVAFPRPAGVEVASQVAAGGMGPRQVLEGITGHPASFCLGASCEVTGGERR